MTMIVGEPSHLRELKQYIRRVNQLNDADLSFRWFTSPIITKAEIEVYDIHTNRTLIIAPEAKVLDEMKRYMRDWDLDDPDA